MSKETINEGQGAESVGMFVAAYVEEMGADHALDSLKQSKKHGGFYYDDAAVVRHDAKGKVHIKETEDMSTGKGVGIGTLIGGVIGLLGGPAGVVVGAGAGAVVGGAAAHHDAGFDNKSLKEIGTSLPSGTSALVVTTSKKFVEEVRKHTPKTETLTMAKEISHEISDHLAARKDVLLAMDLTMDGIAASEVVSSPEEVEVFGIAVSEEEAVAGAGEVTSEGAVEFAAVSTGETKKKE
ncbi:DUF1269 domain-containing protein [Methanolobus zinderi]|jgi:uncharacterized membrane protein|uniref:DUF1269 domain-containing protein n=1 Tax=Methanolobus zinderi TaxID=536044 RepID=A0A7D5E7L2_9EURY|nr:DUF1269 domain-containing protein [Methanolobus zinderi]KXS44670.1 MAG: hypothetical protein AWU59_376 [Methanolobus sp. T82-4]QLC50753.1 DUF1269 domain-containing protein [Methanolobus zinderi]